eukprot:scaffold8654_cov148-Skeletonema_menzelii.AAC.1
MADERDIATKCDAAVVIQSLARTMLCRRELTLMRVAVAKVYREKHLSFMLSQLSTHDLVQFTRVQALFRGKLVRMKYRNAYASAISIQKQWKCKSDLEIVTYSTYVKSILAIQMKFKRYYSLRSLAAKKIQLSYLSRRMKRNLTKVHHSVNLIQRVVRGHRARCFVQRKNTVRHHNAATKIQSIVRAYIRLSELRLAITNATKIQKCYRRFKVTFFENASRGEKKAYIDMLKIWHREAMALRIQSVARSWLGHLKLSNADTTFNADATAQICSTSFNTDDASARVIQSNWRSFRCGKELLVMRAATVVIQSFVRSWLCQRELSTLKSKAVEAELLVKEAAAITLQSFARSIMCQKQLSNLMNELGAEMLSAAVVIQSFVRSWLCQRELSTLKSKAAESELLVKEAAAISLQSFARSIMCQKQLSMLKIEIHVAEMERNETRLLAAQKIQSIFRTHLCRKNTQSAFVNAAKIQSCYRCYKSNTERAHHDEKKAYTAMLERCHQEKMVVHIQAIARSWLCRRKISSADLSATVIQAKWRSYKCKGEILVIGAQSKRKKLAIQSAAAVVIQSVVRSFFCRRELTMIKARLRAREAAALTIQSFTKSYYARMVQSRILSAHLLMKSKSAIRIQSIARMYLFKSRFDVVNKAAFTIQHAWRHFVSSLQDKILVVSDFLAVSRKSCRSHNPIPMHKARTLLPRDLKRLNRIRTITPHLPRRYECGVFIQEVINSVAIVIQSFARRYLVLCQVEKLHEAACRVQKSWRSTSCRKKLNIAALIIQSAARGWLARGNVAAVISSQRCSSIQNEVVRDREAEQNAATLIQRCFRVCLAKNHVIKLRSQRDYQSRLLDEDDDLKRLAQYLASLRFTSKQLEEAAEMQWLEEKTRLAEEVRLANIATSAQRESVKEAGKSGSISALRMAIDTEIDAIMKTIYERAEVIANETNLTTAAQCVKANKRN